METFKHSCPFCGQHVEYTAQYCGQKTACPRCGKSLTFPAVPQTGKGQTQKLKIKLPETAPARKWPIDRKWLSEHTGVLGPLFKFEHWNVVLACLVPFVVVGALLIGAAVVRHRLGNGPATPVVPLVRADAGAWGNMTNLARADQLVQDKLHEVTQARAAVDRAEQELARMRAYSPTATQYIALREQAVVNARNTLSTARLSFYNAFNNYQRLGGTIDYSRQLPN
jgi:hypothetical protein